MIVMLLNLPSGILFDFNKDTNVREWRIVNDVVMGGKSNSNIELTPAGHGVFKGNVSLENNGGFASIRHQLSKEVGNATQIKVRLKGDGKNYQLRLKHESNVGYAYKQEFATTGEWQEITIPLQDFYPSFRGRALDMENFNHQRIEEVSFLIANKKNKAFELLIDKISLVK